MARGLFSNRGQLAGEGVIVFLIVLATLDSGLKLRREKKIFMRKNFKALKIFLLAAALCAVPSQAADMPDTATLSANRMRFDSNTGDFLAEGNVIINAGELNVAAPVGTGNIERREVNFNKGITASGKWQGDKIDIKAGKLELTFNDIPTCKFQNGVRGGIGPMRIDSEGLVLVGVGGFQTPTRADNHTRFILDRVRNLEDTSKGFSFGANSVEGMLRRGELHEMTADKSVWLRGKPKANQSAVSLKGDHAIYSLERGSVVMSGHVTAVQGGRTLRSDSVVYFPEQNRVEALGGITRQTEGGVSTDRAEIVIDLSRENINRKKEEPKQKEEPKKSTTRTRRNSSSSSSRKK